MSAYEAVIGLEIHVELNTERKIFCPCRLHEHAEPNTQTCEICTSMPGTLPLLNRQVVEYAVIAGLALNGTINHRSQIDRKNYFYPDLPKAYQLSQNAHPLVSGGAVTIETTSGTKTVHLTRIHIEEDAGKLIHRPGEGTLVDLNRCGVPLIEIVTEPELSSADEAVAMLKKVRAILVYTGITRARMEAGEMRCDVNVSIRKRGDSALGTRTEMKNLNSFTFVAKAIESEIKRQIEVLESGGVIRQETRRFDEKRGVSTSMRVKEDADDYRYFPDPDLVPIELNACEIEALGQTIPDLPDARKARYVERYGLSPYDAERLTETREMADYFEMGAEAATHKKTLANLIISTMPTLLGDQPYPDAAKLAVVADLQAENVLTSSTTKTVLSAVIRDDVDPLAFIDAHHLRQINDNDVLRPLVLEVVHDAPAVVADYRKGKTNALQSLMGLVMKKTAGRANPQATMALLRETLGTSHTPNA